MSTSSSNGISSGPEPEHGPAPARVPGPRDAAPDRAAGTGQTGAGLSGAGAHGASSFDDVFCALLDRLYRRAAMLVGNRNSAEDAVHEVYLKLAARPQRLLSHPEPYAYAFAALLSVIRDTWRRERRQVPVPEVEPAAPGAQWDGGVERRASELEVVRLLRTLSVRQAGVVVLVDLDGYTIDQAAEILRLHRGTVARTRSRALDKLRGTLGDDTRRPSASGAGGEERRRHAC